MLDTRGMARLRHREIAKLGVGLGSVLLAGTAAWIAFRAFRTEQINLRPIPHKVTPTAAETDIAGLAEVAFDGRPGQKLRGWYAPGAMSAAVILLHGWGADRTGVLIEARALAGAGFGVLLFDLPGHGESDGPAELGEGSRLALVRAVDWLAQRPDVDSSRIGALGFSWSGYVLAQVAAKDARIRATVLESTPGDADECTRWEFGRFGLLTQLPALAADRLAGIRASDGRAIDAIGSISPRPVFLVSGDRDPTVPPFMVEELYASARDPKELWIVPQAGHAGLAGEAPPEFGPRIVGFFRRSLTS